MLVVVISENEKCKVLVDLLDGMPAFELRLRDQILAPTMYQMTCFPMFLVDRDQTLKADENVNVECKRMSSGAGFSLSSEAGVFE